MSDSIPEGKRSTVLEAEPRIELPIFHIRRSNISLHKYFLCYTNSRYDCHKTKKKSIKNVSQIRFVFLSPLLYDLIVCSSPNDFHQFSFPTLLHKSPFGVPYYSTYTQTPYRHCCCCHFRSPPAGWLAAAAAPFDMSANFKRARCLHNSGLLIRKQ